jgi:hypothetical protein
MGQIQWLGGEGLHRLLYQESAGLGQIIFNATTKSRLVRNYVWNHQRFQAPSQNGNVCCGDRPGTLPPDLIVALRGQRKTRRLHLTAGTGLFASGRPEGDEVSGCA